MDRHILLNEVEISTEYLDERFTNILVDLWNFLPETYKEQIAQYWNNEENHIYLDRPIFALIDRPVDGGGHASISLHGFLLRFHREAVKNSDDHSIRRTIAHEIAHVHDLAVKAVKVEITRDSVKINGEIVCSKCEPCIYEKLSQS